MNDMAEAVLARRRPIDNAYAARETSCGECLIASRLSHPAAVMRECVAQRGCIRRCLDKNRKGIGSGRSSEKKLCRPRASLTRPFQFFFVEPTKKTEKNGLASNLLSRECSCIIIASLPGQSILTAFRHACAAYF